MNKTQIVSICLVLLLSLSGCSSLTGLNPNDQTKQEVLDKSANTSENIASVQSSTSFNITTIPSEDNDTLYFRTNATQEIDFEDKEYEQRGNSTSDLGFGDTTVSLEEYYKNGVYYSTEQNNNDNETWTQSEEPFSNAVGDSGITGFESFNDEFVDSLEMEYNANTNEYVFTSNLENNESRMALFNQLDDSSVAFIQGGTEINQFVKNPDSGALRFTIDADTYYLTSFNMDFVGSEPGDEQIKKLDFRFTVEFSQHNNDVKVTVPEKAKE